MCTICVQLGEPAQKWINELGGEIRRGMVMVDPLTKPKSTYTFSASLRTFDNESKVLKSSYQPVINCMHVR